MQILKIHELIPIYAIISLFIQHSLSCYNLSKL